MGVYKIVSKDYLYENNELFGEGMDNRKVKIG